MKRLSLRFRSFVGALLVLCVFIPLSAFTLDRAFTSSLTTAVLEQMRVHSLTLISEFEIQNGQMQMPERLLNDQFNLPESGLYALVKQQQELVWRSLSCLSLRPLVQLPEGEVGKEQFFEDFQQHKEYFLYLYTAEFDNGQGYVPISFYVLQDKSTFNAERRAFSQSLGYWLGGLGLVLLLLLVVSINAALLPIGKLIEQISTVEQGKNTRIKGRYSPELDKLKSSLNHLLDNQQQQRERYKNSLGDLAHSLKTPLAVLNSQADLPQSAREPLGQIDRIIQRQLKRALGQTRQGWQAQVAIAPVIDKLLNAMAKIYADKQLGFHCDCPPALRLQIDQTDLLELLGNLLDNACKAANAQVAIHCQRVQDRLEICIDDDGTGIAPEQRSQLLERGKRLDTYQEGQGIGLALAMDLLSAYNGNLQIEQSPLGGARMRISFYN